MTEDQRTLLDTLREAARFLKSSDVTAARFMGEGIENAARELERNPSEIEKFVAAWTDVVGGGT